jgi:endonuclease/exonuclease/phosphatase family metal-dependent hydrolase
MVWSLAVCSVWSIALLAGGDRIPVLAGLLVPVLAFTPYAAIVSIMMVVCAATLRSGKALCIALASTGAFAVVIFPRAVGDTAPAANGPLLRVLTANLHFGHADARALVDLIRRSHTDVLSLQEFTTQAATALDKEGLAALLPYKVVAPVGGALGSGLYARYPLHKLAMPNMAAVGLAVPRAEVEVPGTGRVQVAAVHMARPVNPTGVGQWFRGFALVPPREPHGVVRILAGDFNATLDHAPMRHLLHTGYVDAAAATGTGFTPTFRKWSWPPITIDHVLVDARCAVRQVAVYELPRSDHRAVFAELRLPR